MHHTMASLQFMSRDDSSCSTLYKYIRGANLSNYKIISIPKFNYRSTKLCVLRYSNTCYIGVYTIY